MNTAVYSLIALLDSVLGEHNGGVPQAQWHCPFCMERVGTESTNRKLSVEVTTGRAKCFRCGFAAASGTTLIKAMSRTLGMTLNAGFTRHLTQAGEEGPSIRAKVLTTLYPPLPKSVESLKPVRLPEDFVPIRKCLKSAICKRAVNYLKKRGVSIDLAEKAGVGYCPIGDFAQRLIFPVRMRGQVVYHTNRYAGEHKLKTKNAKKREGYYGKSDVLLGFDDVIGKRRIFVVEGAFDRFFRLQRTVAALGKELSDQQIDLLEYLAEHGTEEFVVMTDPDADGYSQYQKLVDRLPKVTQARLDYGDPFDRRADYREVSAERHVPSVVDRVFEAMRMGKSKSAVA